MQRYDFFAKRNAFAPKKNTKEKLLPFCPPLEGIENAGCGDGNFRVRRWQSPAAALGIAARGVLGRRQPPFHIPLIIPIIRGLDKIHEGGGMTTYIDRLPDFHFTSISN
ncbi:MAG: hypothetical protein IJK51_10785 [Bacteroidaceae bacterium]|nr:hypothetical protein [Bacteroidaceae bacterium]